MVSKSGKAIIVIILILVLVGIGWIVFTQLRARRLGLPPPTFSSYFKGSFNNSDSSYSPPHAAAGGIVGWVNDKIRAFKNRNNRSTTGAYEEPLQSNVRGRGANRGFGPLDPDDAWDARVGTEADAYGPGGYYEEQELGSHQDTGYTGGGGAGAKTAPAPGQASAGYGEERGRTRATNPGPEPYVGGSKAGLDRRYDEEMGLKPVDARPNPFGDDAEPSNVSLRGVSPRPIDTSTESAKGHGRHDSGDSPTERRSMFRENM